MPVLSVKEYQLRFEDYTWKHYVRSRRKWSVMSYRIF